MSASGERVAVVTGGSQGIGAALVSAYRERGWSVVANARRIKPSGDPGVLAVEGDIADPATADKVISGAVESFGRVDTPINNAGVFISKPFTEYYALIVAVNVTGFFWVTRRAILQMLTQGSGHIVNVSATVADIANSAEPSVLPALTKGGMTSATRSLAMEYASRGIRVNAVSPANIQTPMHPPESYAALARMIPLGRVGQISDVVNGVLFLESSPYITGEIVHIDGGEIAGH